MLPWQSAQHMELTPSFDVLLGAGSLFGKALGAATTAASSSSLLLQSIRMISCFGGGGSLGLGGSADPPVAGFMRCSLGTPCVDHLSGGKENVLHPKHHVSRTGCERRNILQRCATACNVQHAGILAPLAKAKQLLAEG